MNCLGLQCFNLELIKEYSKRVFRFSQYNESDQDKETHRLVIGSCASHTANRFKKQLKKKSRLLKLVIKL